MTLAPQGPPVKDIVREAPRATYQHSSKARDWTRCYINRHSYSLGVVLL